MRTVANDHTMLILQDADGDSVALGPNPDGSGTLHLTTATTHHHRSPVVVQLDEDGRRRLAARLLDGLS
jgi:hypothetical protein